MAVKFTRFTETRKPLKEQKVVSITIRPVIRNCAGIFYITDLQVQEGGWLTGYAPHTESMLQNSGNAPRYHNGVVRGSETVVVFNTGKTSAGLDIYIYPKQDMEADSVSISQGMGSHKCRFISAVNADDALALKASGHECLKNGSPTPKDGFYQYTAAHDSKHHVTLERGKSARVYVEYTEMTEGAPNS